MARPTTKPRVPLLEPEREAINFVRRALEQQRAMAALLKPPGSDLGAHETQDSELRRTALYRDFVQVAQYAVRGEISGRATLPRLLARLASLAQSSLLSQPSIDALLESIDPDDEDDPVKLLLAAAVARDHLTKNHAVSSSQLAILGGVTRRHVGSEIREGLLDAEVAGRRGTAGAALIRPEEARRWLRERGVLGIGESSMKE